MSELAIYSPPVEDRGHMLYDPATFEHGMKVATFLAQSQLVPQHFRGKPADVLLAMNLARRMGEDPLTILQVVHFVSGKPGWHAPFVISRINQSGLFTGPLTFTLQGKESELTVTCKGELKNGGVREVSVSMRMAIDEGWIKNPKYKSMPEVMLRYRAATFFCRLYCPEVLYGMATSDELDDVNASTETRLPSSPRVAGVAAIDAVLAVEDPPLVLAPDPEAQPVGSYQRPAEAPRSTAKPSPSQDAELLRNALGERLPISQELARKVFRDAAGLTKVSEERWRAALGVGVLRAWWSVSDDMLHPPAGFVPEAADPSDQELLTHIGHAEADLTDEQVCDAARAAGLPVVEYEPVVDGAPAEALRRYLNELRQRVSV